MRGVLFDLYETLITEFVPDWSPRPSTAERLGVDETAFAAAWRAHQPGRMRGVYPDYPAALHAICQTLGHAGDATLIEQLHQERLEDKAAPFACVAPEILDLLEQLRRQELTLGVVSNCAPEEVTAWSTCQLAPHFDVTLFSYQVGACKPAPAIYLLACRRLGLAPAEVAFIGDGGSDELVGAAEAGLTAYWATWFLDFWPAWKRSADARRRATHYPRLQAPHDVLGLVQPRWS